MSRQPIRHESDDRSQDRLPSGRTWRDIALDLTATIAPSVPPPVAGTAENLPSLVFAMTITRVDDVRGRGRLASGVIQVGEVTVGQPVVVLARDGRATAATVRGLEYLRSPFRKIGVGDNIGLVLDAASAAAIEVGGQIVTPA